MFCILKLFRIVVDRKLKSLETVVNAELLNVCDWLSANKLSINIKKTTVTALLLFTLTKNV